MPSSSIVLFGRQGQVAREVIRAAAGQDVPLQVFGSADVNFCDLDSIRSSLRQVPIGSVVVNAAAYTQVDLAESEKELAMQINAAAPAAIAEICRDRGLPLIHISTDYVFAGDQQRPYREEDETGPVSVYGRSKLEGETQIRQLLPQALILRTSWVFSAHGKNFVKTMLRLAAQRPEISVVADQSGCPTSAAAIARACLDLASRSSDWFTSSERAGIVHYCGAPATTWYGFAEEIFRQAATGTKVHAITSQQYPTPVQRPAYSVLDCERIRRLFGIPQPDWRTDLTQVLQDLRAEGFPS